MRGRVETISRWNELYDKSNLKFLEQLYQQLCVQQGQHVDRCMLYVFRCGVYFASHKKHDPEKLKWWNWKDSKKS